MRSWREEWEAHCGVVRIHSPREVLEVAAQLANVGGDIVITSPLLSGIPVYCGAVMAVAEEIRKKGAAEKQ